MIEINNNMEFDTAYAALKETVALMETSKNDIDALLMYYERACRLIVYCQRELQKTRGKITEINERVAELRKSGAPLFED